MRGFIFRVCGALLCLTVLLCACQKGGDEVTTTSTVPATTTAAATTQAPTTTTTAPATTTTTKAPTTAAPKKKNNSKTTTTTKAASKTTTTKKPATQTPSQNKVSGAQTGFESDMLKQVNAQRAKNGQSALTLNQSLCASARVRASEIAKDGCFSHTRPDGSGCFTAISGVSYWTAGENIAMGTWGYFGVDEIMDQWMNSEGHRANILNGDFSEVGFGCVVVNGNGYWVQMFIG